MPRNGWEGGTYNNNNDHNNNKEDDWDSVLECPEFENHMKLYRFKQFCKYLPLVFENESINAWKLVEKHLYEFDPTLSESPREF